MPSTNNGAFLYSIARGATISISNSNLSCQASPPNYLTQLKDFLLFSYTQPQYGGAIYVRDANRVQSFKNEFKNCYQTNMGSIFFLTTSPTETTYITEFVELGGSTYSQN